jgi:hypothetical protein
MNRVKRNLSYYVKGERTWIIIESVTNSILNLKNLFDIVGTITGIIAMIHLLQEGKFDVDQ